MHRYVALPALVAASGLASVLASDGRKAWNLACPSTMSADELLAEVDLSGKVFVVTGDGHIAGKVNLALAKRNATVVLGCRKPASCKALKESIEKEAGAGKVETGTLDLSSREIIQSFAADISSRFSHLDALVNMAAVGSSHLSHDGLVLAMEVNLLGPAYLVDLLLPKLRASPPSFPLPGRVVNVAAEIDPKLGGKLIPADATVDLLASWCTGVDEKLNATNSYTGLSKLLLIHHAIELAQREKGSVVTFPVNPGYSLEFPPLPQWLVQQILKLPESVLSAFPNKDASAYMLRMKKACETNFKGLGGCPEAYDHSAAVIVAASAAPGIEEWSGSWLDFESRPLPETAPQIFGPYELHDPNCVPRTPPAMDARLRVAWFDRMLELMRGNGSAVASRPAAVQGRSADDGRMPSTMVV